MQENPTRTPELLRFKDVQARINISRKTWLRLVKEGKAPKAFPVTKRATFYKAVDIERFIKDPLNFEQ